MHITFILLKRLFYLTSLLGILNFTNAQSNKKITIKKLEQNFITKFTYEGTWKITKMEMNIQPRKAQITDGQWFKKEYYVGNDFHFNLNKETVEYRYGKKRFASFLESYKNRKNTFIMRDLTGGFRNIIIKTSANEATLYMSRPVFFLFITNINIRRSAYNNFDDYENAQSSFYRNLLDHYVTVNDGDIIFYLKNIN